ncbi:MAG: leucine--tRNA ligase [Candidatus Aenigmatarchaeota archaeon]
MIDLQEIEKRWQKAWEEEKIFEANAENGNEKKKFFITAAYPYVQAPQHIGHARTYSVADTYARFMRMLGYNVLFPMGWHITGTPIIAISRRIKEKDEKLIKIYRDIFKVPEKKIEEFEDPKKVIEYFIEEIKDGMKRMGFSIDWRREFNTGDACYNKFIEWQFYKLYEKGLLKKGKHPVVWCPCCENPVGEHDTLEDKKGKIEEFTIVKFLLNGNEKIYLPAATLRPETIFGTTNLWINPNENYAKIKINNESWIVSEKSVEKLKLQKKNVEILEIIKGEELIGKEVIVPILNKIVKILPASFVDANHATGVVYSCPAHAPYDWIALKDLGSNYEADKIQPISLVSTPGLGEFPAVEICKKLGIKNQFDEKLEEATQEIYSKEFHEGVLKENTGKYKGMKVAEAREAVKKDLIEENLADIMYELINKPVICRCGKECVVKIIEDQWFIDYANKEWKDLAHKAIEEMNIIPDIFRKEYHNTIDWLEERACARKRGFGTRLPFDREWIIESLSDSTIYMAYYTISHIIKENKINAEQLIPEVFDYVFFGKGNIEEISEYSKISKDVLEKMRKEFSYWYPLDSRHSGEDLITNHLVFFVMNHVAIFPKELWPKQIVTNGFVLNEGQKMSKSLGNIIPLKDAIAKYSADVIRISVLLNASLDQDTNFTESLARTIENKIKDIFLIIEKASDILEEENERWIRSRLARCIDYVTKAMLELRIRDACNYLLFIFTEDIKWHLKKNNKISKSLLIDWIKMLSPFMPFASEELWHRLGNKSFVSIEKWPARRDLDVYAELEETFIINLIEDIKETIKLSKKEKVNKIYVQIAEDWKWDTLLFIKEKGLKEAFKEFGKDKEKLNILPKLEKIIEEFGKEEILMINEFEALRKNKKFIEKEIGIEVEIINTFRDDLKNMFKEKISLPLKPALYII